MHVSSKVSTSTKLLFSSQLPIITTLFKCVRICQHQRDISSFQIGKGVLRILEGDVNKVADIVPIDYCVNMLIAITWYTQQVA